MGAERQQAAFASLATADPEAFKAVVDLTVDFGIFRDAMRRQPLDPAGQAALDAADVHATAAAEAIRLLGENA